MIRIAFFVYKLDTYGGAAAQALKLARALDPASFEVTLFNVSGAATRSVERIDGMSVVHLPRALPARLAALAGALRGIDVVHLHGYFLAPLLLALLARRPVLLKSTLLGDDDFRSLRSKPLGRLRVALARRVDYNNALTRQLQAINRDFLPQERIGVIPNGVRLPERAGDRKERLFLFVGALVPRKRPHLAIEYFAAHYAHLPGARLVLLGPCDPSVPEFDEAYAQRLRARVAGMPAGSVTLAGRVTRAQVDEHFQRALALLFFSSAEGMPNVVLESMACDCVPVVTPMQGVAHEIVEDGRTGFVLDEPPPGPDGLERGPDMPAVPIGTLERLAASGAVREQAVRRYSLESVAHRHADVYRTLAAAGHA